MKSDNRRPLVSIVVPCRDERQAIGGFLQNVLSMERPEGGIEILVVDGLSEDGTRPIVQAITREHEEVVLLDNPAKTTPVALNIGIRASRGQVIVRLDVHTRYARDYIVRCLEALNETGADNVGGPAHTDAHALIQRAVAAAYHSPFSVGGARFHNTKYAGKVDTVTYGCWPRETFARFGLFDEELTRNQDDEHNLRITRGGGLVWQAPSIRSWYTPRASIWSLFRQYFQYGYWKVRVIQKHRLPASWRHLVPAAFVLSLFGGPVASVIWGPVRILLLTEIGAYGILAVAASITVARHHGWGLLPFLPFVFATYHVSYGLGFLVGVVDFLILRSAPRGRMEKITR